MTIESVTPADRTELASDAQPDNETSIAAHLALGFSNEGLVRCFSKKVVRTTRASSE